MVEPLAHFGRHQRRQARDLECHLPPEVHYRRVVGLGMNADELAENPRLDHRVVQDLNGDPRLPFGDGEFDAVVICVSVDYLTRPVEVFRECHRALRHRGHLVTTFSNRCFPTKAIRGWLYSSDEQHCAIVATYFALAGGWDEPVVQRRTPVGHPGDPLYAVWARVTG